MSYWSQTPNDLTSPQGSIIRSKSFSWANNVTWETSVTGHKHLTILLLPKKVLQGQSRTPQPITLSVCQPTQNNTLWIGLPFRKKRDAMDLRLCHDVGKSVFKGCGQAYVVRLNNAPLTIDRKTEKFQPPTHSSHLEANLTNPINGLEETICGTPPRNNDPTN